MSKRSLGEKIEYAFAQFEARGLTVKPGSRFDRMRAVFQGEDGRLTKTVLETDADFRIGQEAMRDFYLLEPILDSLHSINLNSVRLNDLLLDETLPHDGVRTRGRDLQAELLVAAACVRAGLLPVSLEEPDVRAEADGQGWRIAVKRVKNQERLDERLRSAVRQADQWDEPGVVFLDVSIAFNPGDDDVTRPLTSQQYRELAARAMGEGIRTFGRQVRQRAQAKGVGLVLLFFSCLRRDPRDGWRLETFLAGVDTATSPEQQRQCREFCHLLGVGVDRLPE